MDTNYYNFLGVSEYASQDEIKRACFRKRKELTINKDQKGIEFLNEVSKTLQDEHQRKEYDALKLYGDEIRELMDTANEAMQAEKWDEAISDFKHVVALVPDQQIACNLLGLCYLYSERFEEALRIYKKLTSIHNNDPLYWSNYGCVYLAYARNNENNKSEYLRNARECFNSAIALESYNSSHYIGIASAYEAEKNYPMAIEWAKKSLSADEKIDIQDTENIIHLCRLYALSFQENQIMPIARKLHESISPDDTNSLQYCAYAFAIEADELFKIEVYDLSLHFINCALIFTPDEKELKKFKKNITDIQKAYKEFDRLEHDYNICESVKRLVAFSFGDYLGEKIDDRDNLLQDIINHLNNTSAPLLKQSILYIKTNYQSLYRINSKVYDQIYDNTNSEPDRNPDGCGCILPAIVAFVPVIIYIFFIIF